MDSLGTTTIRIAAVEPKRRDAPAAEHGKSLPPPGKESPPETPSIDLEAIAAQLETYLSSSQRALSFSVDEASGRPVITVTNPETGEVIRQIPGEEALRIAAAMANGDTRLIDTLA